MPNILKLQQNEVCKHILKLQQNELCKHKQSEMCVQAGGCFSDNRSHTAPDMLVNKRHIQLKSISREKVVNILFLIEVFSANCF